MGSHVGSHIGSVPSHGVPQRFYATPDAPHGGGPNRGATRHVGKAPRRGGAPPVPGGLPTEAWWPSEGGGSPHSTLSESRTPPGGGGGVLDEDEMLFLAEE